MKNIKKIIDNENIENEEHDENHRNFKKSKQKENIENEAHQENFCKRQLQEKSFLLKFLQGQTNKSFTRKKNNLRIFPVEKNSCLIFYVWPKIKRRKV